MALKHDLRVLHWICAGLALRHCLIWGLLVAPLLLVALWVLAAVRLLLILGLGGGPNLERPPVDRIRRRRIALAWARTLKKQRDEQGKRRDDQTSAEVLIVAAVHTCRLLLYIVISLVARTLRDCGACSL